MKVYNVSVWLLLLSFEDIFCFYRMSAGRLPVQLQLIFSQVASVQIVHVMMTGNNVRSMKWDGVKMSCSCFVVWKCLFSINSRFLSGVIKKAAENIKRN